MVACAAMHESSTDSTAGKHQTPMKQMHKGDVPLLNVWHLQDKEQMQNDYDLHVLTHWHGVLQCQRSHA